MQDLTILERYLSAKPGAVRDYKEEWGWHRWNVGGKMFAAICTPGAEHKAPYAGHMLLNLKCAPEDASLLCGSCPGIHPGFYMNKQSWIAVFLDTDLAEEQILSLCDRSYQLVFSKLTKKLQKEILEA